MKIIRNNKTSIFCLLLGVGIGLLIMSFQIKEKAIPLPDGTIPIVSLKDTNITSSEYYELLKKSSSIEILLEMIDNKLLSDKYILDDKKISNIKEEMNETINLYTKYYDTTEKEFLNNNGFKNKDEFLDYLILEEKRTLYEEDYLKEQITTSEINNYYINKINNDFEIMYIKGDDTTLSEILIKLNNGEKQKDILNEYRNVEFKNLGYISFDDNEVNPDIYNDAKSLKENEHTTSLRSINNEYYIIFKGKEKEKDSVINLKDRIINAIVKEKIENDEDKILYKKALINLRDDNNITFYDSHIESLYKLYIKK